MSATWQKLGWIFTPRGERSWMHSHASVPIPLRVEGDRYRVYFGARDADNHPHIAYLELDIRAPQKILHLSEHPVLGPGPLGHFDDNGVYPGCIVEHGAELCMYFLGRSNGTPPLYYMGIGLAASTDGGRAFRRKFNAPLLGRSEFDPWMVTTPFVLREHGRWRMWYASGLGWDRSTDPPHSRYHVKYAESDDGIHWRRQGRVCIDLREGETNIASPVVLKQGGRYRMWYCYVAGQGYRIGYAESVDGCGWRRKDDEVGIGLSAHGWDSQAMAYPYVFVHDGRTYMLYSGNGFGRDGFGLAVEGAST